MGFKLFILLQYVLIYSTFCATENPTYLKRPDADKEVIFSGLSDDERKSLIKANSEFGESLKENSKSEKGNYEEDMLDDNCQCSPEEPSCACSFQMKFMNLHVLYAVGYKPDDDSIAVILAIDGHIIVNDQISNTPRTYKPPCMSLPPPTFWLAGCLQMEITKKGQGSTICGTVDLEISLATPIKRIISMDISCFGYEKVGGKGGLIIKDQPMERGKNVRAVKGFEKAAEEFNKFKRSRVKENDLADDPLEESFWDQVPFDNSPTQRSSGSPKIVEKVDWWFLGLDEIPYLTILFRGFVAPRLKYAQGIAGFQMIEKAKDLSIATSSSNWHQTVIPDVFEPGSSCGGALLSQDKVLTVCACVRSFYYFNKNKKPATGKASKFDIKFDGNADIFLEFFTTQSRTRFNGIQYHHLDRDPSKYDAKSACFKLIESGSDGQQAELVVMPITPKIRSANPYLYVLWPPYPIHEKYKMGPASNLISIGMESKVPANYSDLTGDVIDVKTTGVSILIKRDKMTDHCMKQTFEKSAIPDPFKAKTTCFHSKGEKYQLCKGLVGFPITFGDELAGLTASPADCQGKEGSVMGAVFNDQSVKEIETFMGKNIQTQRKAAHAYLYREEGHIVHIIPDYTTSDATPKPYKGAASPIARKSYILIPTLICATFYFQ